MEFGGAVGVLPPESKTPNRRILQAQLRLYLDRTDASKRGLPCAADSFFLCARRINRAHQPELLTGRQSGSGRPSASGDYLRLGSQCVFVVGRYCRAIV